MRVLIFTDEYDYGYFTFIYNEIKQLEAAGVELHVVCERTGKLKETDTDYTRIPMIKNALFRNFYLATSRRRLFFLTSFFPYFSKRQRIIRDYKPDIIHLHFGDTATRLFFPLKSSIRNIPFVVSFHGFDASNFLSRAYYVENLRHMIREPRFHGICVSRHLKENLVRKDTGINDRNSSILYYGTNVDMFRRTRRENNKVRIFLQISSFYEKKGHIYTLQAFRKFLDRNEGKAKLIIGGDGPRREGLMQLARELGLTDAVEFPGWINRDQAVRLLDEADYFVHHSITADNGDQEGMPNAIIEAMAMELPVISTHHSGIPELMEDGVNGYLVKEKDVDAYAVKMEQILSWTYLPASREKIEQHFSLPVHTKGLLSIYQQQLDNSSK